MRLSGGALCLAGMACWCCWLTPRALAALPRQVGAPLADVMVAVGMQPSKAAVRRMIKARCGWQAATDWAALRAGLLLLLLCSHPSIRPPSCPALLPPASPALLQGGGVRVNNGKVDDELHTLGEADLIDGRLVLIAAGKKNKMLVRVAA